MTFNPAADELTYIDENGVSNTVSLAGLISAQNDLNDGHLIGEHIAGDGTVTPIEETVTEISFNNATNQIEYIDENGDTQAVNLGDLVSQVTDLNAGEHQIATHVSGDGTTTPINETVTAISYDDSNTRIVYIDEAGNTQNVDLTGLLSSATDLNDGHLIAQHTDGDGNVTDIEETVTELGFNSATNQIEYTDENGDVNPVDLGDLVSNVTDLNAGEHQIATHVSGDGTTTPINETVTSLSYDDTNTRIQYTDESGTTQNVDLSGLLSSAADLNDGNLIAQHTDGNGNVTNIEETVTSLEFNSSNNRIEYTDENGDVNPVDLGDLVSNVTDLNAGEHQIATHVSGDGTTTPINETVTSLSYDDTNTRIQYTDESGTTQNVDLSGLLSDARDLNDGNLIAQHVDGDGNVTDIEETVTTFVDNGDGTYTYTSEDGTTTTTATEKDCFYPPSVPIDASTTGVKTLDLHQEYIDQYGSPVISSPGAGAIPTYTESELDYHILDFDSTTIRVNSISAQGIMSYEVLEVPRCNCSYINTLFCEK